MKDLRTRIKDLGAHLKELDKQPHTLSNRKRAAKLYAQKVVLEKQSERKEYKV